MTLDEIADDLPWGFHDAHIEAVRIDLTRGHATLDMRFPMTKSQDMDQRGRVELTGLVYWVTEPPTIDPSSGYHAHTPAGIRIDLTDAKPTTHHGQPLPACPQGAFANVIYVSTWNTFIHVCAHDAKLTWVEKEPQPARDDVRALYAGDEVGG